MTYDYHHILLWLMMIVSSSFFYVQLIVIFIHILVYSDWRGEFSLLSCTWFSLFQRFVVLLVGKRDDGWLFDDVLVLSFCSKCIKGRLQWNFLGIDSSKLCDTSANCGQVLIQLIWSNFGANCKTLLSFLLEKEHCQYWLSFVSSYPNQHLVSRYIMGWLQWLFCE